MANPKYFLNWVRIKSGWSHHKAKESQFIIDTFLKSREVSISFPRDDCSHEDKKMFKIFSRKMIYETAREPFVSTDVAEYSKAFETRMAVE